jgi:hypothetical protein
MVLSSVSIQLLSKQYGLCYFKHNSQSHVGETILFVIVNYVQNCLSKKTFQQRTVFHMKYGATCTISWDRVIHLKHTSLKAYLIDGSVS